MGKTKIFVVNEKADFDKSLTTILKNINCRVINSAVIIEEAVAKVKLSNTDLIIWNVKYKNKNQLIKPLNKLHLQSGLPVILLTDSFDEKVLASIKSKQLFGWLTTPYSQRELKFTIEMALNKARVKDFKNNFNMLLKAERKINQIVNTADNDKKLAKDICKTFVTNAGFDTAFIALTDKSNKIVYTAQFGLKDIISIESSLEVKKWPIWIKKTLSGKEILEIKNRGRIKHPLVKPGKISLNIRLESSGRIFGLLSVVLKKREILSEEKSLFKSIASNIAFSLYNIEIKNKSIIIEEYLAGSEAKYRMVIENATDIIFTTNEFGNFTFVNFAGLLNTGYSEEELLKSNYMDLILPEYKDSVRNFYREQSEAKQTSAYIEYPFYTKKGEIKWYGQNSTLILENNNFKGFHCISRDITERKEIEFALQESEKKYWQLVKSSPNAIIVHQNGKIVFVNNSCLKLAGINSESELLNKQIMDYIHSDSQELAKKTLNKSGTIGASMFFEEFKLLRPDKKIIEVEIARSSVIFNNKNCTQIVINDISERKRIEEELRKHQSEVTTLIDNLPGFAFLKDVNGKYIVANQKFCNAMGVTKEQLIGNTDYEFMEPERAEIYYAQDVRVMKSGKKQSFYVEELYIDNKFLTIGTRKVPIKDENGNAFGLIGLGIDITEQKEVEEAIKRYTKELEDLNANKDKFFSIISHDLRSPFQGLLGLSNALDEEYDNLRNDEIRMFIRSINSSAKNLYNLIENLLQWSRAQKSNIEMNLKPVDLHDEIEYIISLLQNNADNKHIEIINKTAKGIFVHSDINIFDSTIQNLISNAIKFTKPNGKVVVSSIKKKLSVDLIVKDNGVGIPKENLEKLFRIDKKLSTPGTEMEPGTGLGLLICKELIEMQGGTIKVKSKLNAGTEFIVSFQLYSEEI